MALPKVVGENTLGESLDRPLTAGGAASPTFISEPIVALVGNHSSASHTPCKAAAQDEAMRGVHGEGRHGGCWKEGDVVAQRDRGLPAIPGLGNSIGLQAPPLIPFGGLFEHQFASFARRHQDSSGLNVCPIVGTLLTDPWRLWQGGRQRGHFAIFSSRGTKRPLSLWDLSFIES